MTQKPTCPRNDYSTEAAELSVGLHTLLTDLVRQSIKAGSTEAAAPLIEQAAMIIATEFVSVAQKQIAAAAMDAFFAGRAEAEGGVQ